MYYFHKPSVFLFVIRFTQILLLGTSRNIFRKFNLEIVLQHHLDAKNPHLYIIMCLGRGLHSLGVLVFLSFIAVFHVTDLYLQITRIYLQVTNSYV